MMSTLRFNHPSANILDHQDRKKYARQFQSIVKVLLTVFLGYNGVVNYEFLPEDQTVNIECYLEVMCHLH